MSPKIVRVTSYYTIVFVKLKTVEEKAISDLKLIKRKDIGKSPCQV
jgi:hypothetical protein